MTRETLAGAIQASLEKSKFRVDINKATHRGDGTASARLSDVAGDAQAIAADVLGGCDRLAVKDRALRLGSGSHDDGEPGGVRVTRETLRDVLTGARVNVSDVTDPDVQGSQDGEVSRPDVFAKYLFRMLAREDPGCEEDDLPGTRVTVDELADALRGQHAFRIPLSGNELFGYLNRPEDVAESVLQAIAAKRRGPLWGTRVVLNPPGPDDEDEPDGTAAGTRVRPDELADALPEPASPGVTVSQSMDGIDALRAVEVLRDRVTSRVWSLILDRLNDHESTY